MDSIAQRLRGGLFPAVPVPHDAAGRIDWSAQAAYVDWMSTQPAAGVAVWAHTGRGLLLAEADRQRVLRAWVDAAGDRLVIAGVGAVAAPGVSDAEYLAGTLRLAHQAVDLGAGALMMYAPVLFRGRADQDARILEYARALDAVGAPLLLFYLYEAAGGVSYSPVLLAELLALPHVVGIKMATLDSIMTFQDTAALIAETAPDRVLVTGEDRFLGYSLSAGAEAALIGMAAARTAPQAELIAAWREGRYARFHQLSRALDAFSRVTFRAPMDGYVQRMLWCLAADGVIPDTAAHDPHGPPLAPTERAEVSAAVAALHRAIEVDHAAAAR